MRGLRSFFALLVILVALGAYLYFVESKRTPGDTEKRPTVFAVEADAIDEVTVRSEAGEQTTAKKSGTTWQITAPAAAPADDAELSGITTNLSTLEEQRLIEENAGDLNEFGLAKPRIEVAFRAGGAEHRLLIGRKTPTGSDLYAKTGASGRVFLIAGFLDSTFNRGPFDLRDKSALTFNREAVDRIEITTPGRAVRFTKADSGWQIAEPAGGRPDVAAIEGLLARAGSLQMQKIESAAAGDLASYGLQAPAATLRIGSGAEQSTLLLGGAAADGQVYAKNGARPEVFTVDASFLEDLKKDPGEYRQKDLFDARAFNTTRIEVERGGQTQVLEKSGGTGGTPGTWRRTAPAAGDVDAAKIEALLSALTSGRAESFMAASPAGASTEAVISLTVDKGKQERVTLLRAGADAYALRDGGVAKIDSAVLDGILKALADI